MPRPMNVEYLDLAHHVAPVSGIVDLGLRALQRVSKVDLADSVLCAPPGGGAAGAVGE